MRWEHNLVPNHPSTKKSLEIVTKVDIKFFGSYPVLLGFFSLSSIFCPVLQADEKMNVQLNKRNIRTEKKKKKEVFH